ncbi:hypothetical protein ABW19_dt0208124 [Dactylella cylindrospora]|nr:hypothetical protein ABW19_dt0208124 [Dactylella cylindrospora]
MFQSPLGIRCPWPGVCSAIKTSRRGLFDVCSITLDCANNRAAASPLWLQVIPPKKIFKNHRVGLMLNMPPSNHKPKSRKEREKKESSEPAEEEEEKRKSTVPNRGFFGIPVPVHKKRVDNGMINYLCLALSKSKG